MKTKIIYISGNEIFDMQDIRSAFEEVRNALNLDKDTVMFGVPVDSDDVCLSQETSIKENTEIIQPEISDDNIEQEQIEEHIEETKIIDIETLENPKDVEASTDIKEEIVPETKKRGRPRKEKVIEETPVVISEEEPEEKTIPILSILSTKETSIEPAEETILDETENESVEDKKESIDIIQEISEEQPEDAVEVIESTEDSEPDLEQLLSEMTPLAEDNILEDNQPDDMPTKDEPTDLSVDATLEQLATEYAETQDKIKSETKSQSRSKIGKLRNILPFKQSKHKDQGIGDLLEWAGIAANDEDFSVPGFFTNAASRK
nr:hypothetical protein [Candidatus Enterousia merdequi]